MLLFLEAFHEEEVVGGFANFFFFFFATLGPLGRWNFGCFQLFYTLRRLVRMELWHF